jgi:hypothetical protein
MTSRFVGADGSVLEFDEETHTAGLTHIDSTKTPGEVTAVAAVEYLGPTPPKSDKPGESAAQKRDRLRAELAALDDDDEPAVATPSPAGSAEFL